jgi:hypothetical protein
LAFPGDNLEVLPDGSAAKGMITPEAERAIEAGLAYLKNNKAPNGSWGTNAYRGNVAVTSLAALAFMAGGHQPGRGAYGSLVTEALRYVLAQKQNGQNRGYLHNTSGHEHGPMYGHGFGTLFLAEACGMVHEPRLRDEVRSTLKEAVDLILRSQNTDGNAKGGWRYHPSSRDADISVTICQIMALRAARNAGIAVPKNQVDLCVDYVKRCQDRLAGWFSYQTTGRGGAHQAFARTAAGICAYNSAGIYLKDKDGNVVDDVKRGLDFLMQQHKPNGQPTRHDMHYFYGHYYAAQAMWTAGGDYWREWFPAIRDELISLQRRGYNGAWPDPICIHYGTAMACIILQIPNNYLPILQK